MPDDVYARALARLDAAFTSGFDSMMDGKTACESLKLLRALLLERQTDDNARPMRTLGAKQDADAALRAFTGGEDAR